MSTESKEPNIVQTYVSYGIRLLIFVAVIAVILYIVSKAKEGAQNLQTLNTIQQSKAISTQIASKFGADEGRVNELWVIAQHTYDAIHNYLKGVWTDSKTAVSELNKVRSGDEMKIVAAIYNDRISDGKKDLKIDLDSHVIDWSSTYNAKDIKYYTFL